mmetsp:Transcript_25311/g.83153  ORF Transcript_25311/g.83153 Transcript_25311/m.83153 type:complete len:210 (-) Transcript_25311:690-1319(-)
MHTRAGGINTKRSGGGGAGTFLRAAAMKSRRRRAHSGVGALEARGGDGAHEEEFRGVSVVLWLVLVGRVEVADEPVAGVEGVFFVTFEAVERSVRWLVSRRLELVQEIADDLVRELDGEDARFWVVVAHAPLALPPEQAPHRHHRRLHFLNVEVRRGLHRKGGIGHESSQPLPELLRVGQHVLGHRRVERRLGREDCVRVIQVLGIQLR